MGYVLVFLGGGLGRDASPRDQYGDAAASGSGFPLVHLSYQYYRLADHGPGGRLVRVQRRTPRKASRLFLTTGILGGYTTFSAFSLDTALLYERGDIGLAAAYVIGSVVLSIAGLFAGFWIVRSLICDERRSQNCRCFRQRGP